MHIRRLVLVCFTLLLIAACPPATAAPRLVYHDDHAVYEVKLDGTRRELARDNDGYVWSAVWSPDGREVAYVVERGLVVAALSTEVWITDVASGEHHRILSLPQMGAYALDWSSQDRLAFELWKIWEGGAVWLNWTHSDVYVVNADGTDLAPVTADGISSSPVWSPDGTRLAYQSSRGGLGRIYVSPASLLGPATAISKLDQFAGAPAWSPDGHTVAYLGRATPLETEPHIWLGDADGAAPSMLDQTAEGLYPLSWAPDGHHLAYSRSDGARALDLDSAKETLLAPERAPVWAPDGRHLALLANDLVLLDAVTGARTMVDVGPHSVSGYRWTR